MPRDEFCLACDGEGLLMDDEEWRYTCKVCGGSGYKPQEGRVYNREVANVDEMNRLLD
ncbi:hypothetical protein H0266_17430 [Halobacillus locisalis]|uniref:Uncharacterized protein n=1 Tax=Halobacillus locisalis TaxID=220753 RepID=A0A838CXM5_9BACI|nr:hypothetical protein [Halobacillus locisalis]MBA2176673.1 hypothetical protein [Halobacillus locisalis]